MKTWTDLLGTDADDCVVDGLYISRKNGDKYTVLWTFESFNQAKNCMLAWLDEIRELKNA